ncbi:MAG: hypothetical protein JSU82_16070 [Rhodospirillales bacterium]|nr:MAG: hypothetical protein JSU82_16070 [Rhodospirillales bacterium]
MTAQLRINQAGARAATIAASRRRASAALGLALALFGCATTPPAPIDRPERIVLHYDFAGDWAATAGDSCDERLDLSEGVFVGITRADDSGPSAFYVSRFFMLETYARAQALVGRPDANGALPLTVETEGTIDGRNAAITYDLTLEPLDPRRVRLTAFAVAVRDRAGQAVRRDLLAEAEERTIPVLSEAGELGLCLKRL